MRRIIRCLSPLAAALACVQPLSSPVDEERVVREAYARLAGYSAAAGTPLAFELQDFDTLLPSRWKLLRLQDLATLPEGEVIDVVREARQVQGAASHAVYRAAWNHQEHEWKNSDEGKQWRASTLDVFFAEAARRDPAFAGIEAVTAYHVKVSLAGKQRSYRAAFLWRSDGAAGRSFVVVDHLTQSLSEAAAEMLPPLDRSIQPAPQRPAGHRTALMTSCQPSSDSITHSQSLTGVDHHLVGSHAANAGFQYSCTCDSACQSTCAAQLTSGTCDDSGLTWDSCHVTRDGANVGTVSVFGGDKTPASCAAGYGCVVKSCFGCICSLGVTVSVSGVSVSFSANGTPDWTMNLTDSAGCPPCQAATPVCCASGQCGFDPVCGIYCDGACPGGYTCSNYTCVPLCTSCQGQSCGADHCGTGVDCGTCPSGMDCDGTVCYSVQTAICGDGVCDVSAGEDCQYCPQDCGACGGGGPGDCCADYSCDDPGVCELY
jgi:hypothetical protein